MSFRTKFHELFGGGKALIGCIHLMPLPGSPGYEGSMDKVIETALQESAIYRKYGFDGIIIENFGDAPFYPDMVPAGTISAMSVVVYELLRAFNGRVGVNILRNDAVTAMAVATVTGAHFIRVNIHMGMRVTDQGVIQGKSFETLRLKKNLGSEVLIFADAGVKHSYAPGRYPLEQEAEDLARRGLADAIILTGVATGKPVDPETLSKIKEVTKTPVIIGSGTNPENIVRYIPAADGFIVGSSLKKDGIASNRLEEERVARFSGTFREFTGRFV
ncbi:MAG: BtpA/SgcQ family protein [Bacteroidales bacterium]|nr:BtpA/SgcQ family protein [Bacteroidales bacterium]